MSERLTFAEARALLAVEPGADSRTLRRAFAEAARLAAGDEPVMRRLIAAWRKLAPPDAADGPAWLPAAFVEPFRTELRVRLADALKGEDRLISIPGSGAFRIRVPAGARDGLVLRLAGKAPGGGDVLIRVRVGAAERSRHAASDMIRRFSRAWAA